jgi:CubicO group peptidase (beta-lactamase class C family)
MPEDENKKDIENPLKGYTKEAFYSYLKTYKLPFQPGSKYLYSNVGMALLGQMLESWEKTTYEEMVLNRICFPLGMNDTWFYLPEEKHDRLVNVQYKKDGKWQNYPVTFYDPDYPKKGAKRFFSGGAGLSSTAKDYATFLQMYLNNGTLNGVRILSRTTVQSIMGNQSGELFGGDAKDYGLAFGLVTAHGQDLGGQGSKGTFDWGGYFNTQYFADPKEQIIGILMKQTQSRGDQTGWKFRQMVFAAVDD